MCVIVYKKRGFEIPSKKFLRRCWLANPDGAGFAYNDNKQVYFHKGFKTFDEFYSTLIQADNLYSLKNKDLLLHFRIATSGGVKPEKTHPFVVTTSYKQMEQLDGTCKTAFFHNGILSEFASDKYSDTENFTAMILANVKNLEKQDVLFDYLAKSNNSRFALITKDKVLLGNDYLYDCGMLVSNKNYSYYHNSSYNYYDKTKYSQSMFDSYFKDTYLYDDYNQYDIMYTK